MSNTRRTKSVQFRRNSRSRNVSLGESNGTDSPPKRPRKPFKIQLKHLPSRLMGVWIVLGLGALGLLMRLGWLQILAAADLQKSARSHQVTTVRPFVPRRPIIDRNGNFVAIDRPSYAIYANPQAFKQTVPSKGGKSEKIDITPTQMAQTLAPILNRDPAQLAAQFQTGKRIRLGYSLSEDVKARIEALHNDGLEINKTESYYTRFYPQNDMLAEILGYLDLEHKAKAGVEASQSSLLERKVDDYTLSQTRNGGILPDLVKTDLLHTDDLKLQLTVDLRLQRAAREALRHKMKEWDALRGTVIVMDAQSGAIRAMVVEPTYDPNHYADYANSGRSILFKNWAVSDTYEPGSTFKPLNVAIALDNGIIKPNTTFYDGGAITVGIRTFKNADKKGNGTIDVAQVLQHSSNVGMVQMMQKLQPNIYYDWLQRIGLDRRSGIDLPAEARGSIVPFKDFKSTPEYRATSAFGQGGFSLSPIQLTTMTASLANGGKSVVPHLVEGLFDSHGIQQNKLALPESRQIFSPETADTVLKMMETVVTNKAGSGGKAKICGYRVAGKTGTAQKNGNKGYQEDSKKITSFIGILPVDQQHRYVVFAAIDRPNENRGKAFGSNVAAPVVKTVMESLIAIEGIPPSDLQQKCLRQSGK
jgi:cell division protein FtsI (penicillin-binding protein 3)